MEKTPVLNQLQLRDLLSRKRTSFILGVLLGALFLYLSIGEQNHRLHHIADVQAISDLVKAQLSALLPDYSADLPFLGNITSFISENILSADSSLPGSLIAAQGMRAHFPVFIIPGIVSTNLESWARGGCSEQYFRKKIWGDLTMATSLLLDKQCWIGNMMLDRVTGLDPDGVKIRAVQGLDAANYFIPGYWVWARVMDNLAAVGYDSNNMHLAQYDWRLSMDNMEVRDRYFSKLKSNLELSFRTSGGRKAVLISHSMGGNVMHYFLKWVESRSAGNGDQRWVHKHIHAAVNIATPFLGAPKSVASVVSGEMRDTAQLGWLTAQLLERFFTRRERADMFRSWGGVASMLPKGGDVIWGNRTHSPSSFPPDNNENGTKTENNPNSNNLRIGETGEMIMFRQVSEEHSLTHTNYTATSLFELLQNYTGAHFSRRLRQSASHGIKLQQLDSKKLDRGRYWTNPLEYSLPDAPEMTVYSFYGTGKPVERAYFFRSSCSADGDSNTNAQNSNINDDTLINNHSQNDEQVICGDGKLHLSIDAEFEHSADGVMSGVLDDLAGDGTVPLVSLGYVPLALWSHPSNSTKTDNNSDNSSENNNSSENGEEWNYAQIYNPHRVKTVTREYEHDPVPLVKDARGGPKTADHVDILGNHALTRDLLLIVTNNADSTHSNGDLKDSDGLRDQIYSRIRDIARRIRLRNLDL